MANRFLELVPKQQTLAKAKAVQGKDLSDKEKFTITKDKPFKIDDYQVDEAGHYKVHLYGEPHDCLKDTALIWPGHFEAIPELLRITHNTVLKKDPKKQSGELSESQVKPCTKGQVFVIKESGEIVNKCVKVSIVTDSGNTEEWWAFLGDKDGHVELCGTEPDNDPTKLDEQKKPPKVDKGAMIRVPGISAPVYLNDGLDLTRAKNITWNEMTKGGSRIPPTAAMTGRMIEIAIEVQKVRDKYGKPCFITSGYRPKAINERVGGARFSRHTDPYGDAVDFYVDGVRAEDVYRMMNQYWGSKGGLAFSPRGRFTHCDLRRTRSRWTYP